MEEANKPKWYKRWWGVIIIIVILLFLTFSFFFAFSVLRIIKEVKDSPSSPVVYGLDEQRKGLIEGESPYWLGTDGAKVTIVEFGDYACSVCKKSFPKVRELGIKYKDKIKYIFRDYPVVTEQSLDLAMAANCAGEQGLFWVAHDKLFINQGVNEKDDIKALASQIGIDKAKFDNCFDNQKYLAQIKKDAADAERLEVEGTPTFFINGQKISGDIPYELLENIIIEISK